MKNIKVSQSKNWYNRQKPAPKSRYTAIINADIFVPAIDDKEQEKSQVEEKLIGISIEGVRINNYQIEPYTRF